MFIRGRFAFIHLAQQQLPLEQPPSPQKSPHLSLPKRLAPIKLPEKKSAERDVLYVGEVQYVPPSPQLEVDSSGCCCSCLLRRRGRPAHTAAAASHTHTQLYSRNVDVQMSQTAVDGLWSAKMPSAEQPAAAEPVRVAVPDEVTASIAQPAGWAASPLLKGLLRSPFLNGMRSVSRDHPGRAYRRRTASAPALHSEDLEVRTASRVAFSVHA